MSALRLAAKDLALEARTRELLDAALLGAVALAVLAGLSFAAIPEGPERTSAVLWSGLALATLLPLARSFTGETDRGTLEVLLLLPTERGHILLGKVLTNTLLALTTSMVLLAAYAALFGGALPALALAPVVGLGALGLGATGSILAAIAAQARAREALLPVLLFPLLLPVLLSGVPASIHALRGDPLGAIAGELALLLGYDLLMLAAGWLLFETVAEG